MEETLEQLQSRHRKEQRDLQSRITQKKKSATKKTRKGVNDECAELERQLKQRQEDELRRLTDPESVQDVAGEDDDDEAAEADHHPDPSINEQLSSKLESTSLSSPPSQQPAQPVSNQTEANAASQGGGKKRNRQKERLARRAAEVSALSSAAAAEAATMTDHRSTEKSRMEPVFTANRLVETEIAPDGHCLFASFASGLKAVGLEPSSPSGLVDLEAEGAKAKVMPYKVVRRVAAGYMTEHRGEFEGFMEEGFEEYVGKIRDTAEWGGQLELSALANAYGVEVRVVQDGRVEVITPSSSAEETGGDKGERKTVWLSYYRHGFGLGEHYNSLRRKEDA